MGEGRRRPGDRRAARRGEGAAGSDDRLRSARVHAARERASPGGRARSSTRPRAEGHADRIAAPARSARCCATRATSARSAAVLEPLVARRRVGFAVGRRARADLRADGDGWGTPRRCSSACWRASPNAAATWNNLGALYLDRGATRPTRRPRSSGPSPINPDLATAHNALGVRARAAGRHGRPRSPSGSARSRCAPATPTRSPTSSACADKKRALRYPAGP